MALKTKTQKIASYFAVFEAETGGAYSVSFPDFPGCVTFGRNFEEAKVKATEVLELWLEELAAQKAEIPAEKHRPIIDEIRVVLRTA